MLPELVARLVPVDAYAPEEQGAGVVAGESTPAPAAVADRKAAVLALIGPEDDLVLTVRARTLRAHAGQVALPGGAVEQGENAIVAAVRETHEEVGVEPHRIHLLGVLPESRRTVTGFAVSVVVGEWDGTAPLQIRDLTEVASIHRVGLSELARPDNRFTWTLPGGHSGPGFSAGGLFVWGFTGQVVSQLLDLGRWRQPWDTRRRRSVPPELWQADAVAD